MGLVNGELVDHVSLQDRGLHYGDGLFETMAVRLGEVRLLDMHLDRMEWGCARLDLTAPAREDLRAELAELSRGVDQGVLKVILTRGTGGRGYRPAPRAATTRILSLHPWPDYPDDCYAGVAARVCATRAGLSPALAGVKHLNRLEQVLARGEWSDRTVQEGIMLDTDGRVVGGTMSNVFVVRGGRLATPRITRAGVRGVMRSLVIELARERQIAVEECDLSLDELVEGEEIFFTNALIGIWPAVTVEQWKFSVGPVTRELMRDLGSRGIGECAERA